MDTRLMVTVQEILDSIKYDSFLGDSSSKVTEVVQLGKGGNKKDVLSWCSGKNIEALRDITSGTIICPILPESPAPGVNYIVTAEPRTAFRKVLESFFVQDKVEPGVEASSFIDASVRIGKNVYIGHHNVIEKNCSILDGTVIGHNNVLKAGTVIGKGVKIGSNNTIGGVGFGYEKDEEGVYQAIPHIGNVVIEDFVEVGNNNTIDRAVLGSTILRKHSKIDNLVHIAHGVEVGENSLVIANAMVAGSVVIGKNSWIAPSSSILNKTTVGNNVTVGMGAVVLKPVPDNDVIVGNPSRSIKKS